MRSILLIAITLFLTGCVKDYAKTPFNFEDINNAAAKVLSSEEVNADGYAVQILIVPEQIEALDPQTVYVTNEGLFIQLDSFFVSESGLFIPNKHMDSVLLKSADPKYTRLSENVYSYVISG